MKTPDAGFEVHNMGGNLGFIARDPDGHALLFIGE